MTTSPSIHRRIAPIAVLAVALAAVDWLIRPERGVYWSLSLGMVAVIWAMVALLARSSVRTRSQRDALVASGVFGASLIVATLLIGLLRGIGQEHSWLAERAFGIILGLYLMATGNALPKASAPLEAGACGSVSFSARRFSGWALVIAGAISLSGWLFAPIADADVIMVVSCATALMLIAARCLLQPSRSLDGAND